jgi:hypothetical protein
MIRLPYFISFRLICGFEISEMNFQFLESLKIGVWHCEISSSAEPFTVLAVRIAW